MLTHQSTQMTPQWLRLTLALLGIFFFLGAVSPAFADMETNSSATTSMQTGEFPDIDGPTSVSLNSVAIEASINALLIFGAGFLVLSGLTLVAYRRKQKEEAEKRLQTLRVRRKQR